ncbi:hypothetical protein LCGC14_1994130 [marine sediment metagenome]|uniref:JAB domain-containing protein n=1 Tax=marine sediment metagenome TaxID=412755 RepID=A0A0F9F4Z2_9ZZZZ
MKSLLPFLFLLTSCTCFLKGGGENFMWPMREVVETRNITGWVIEEEAREQIRQLYNEAFPLEMGACLYGKVDEAGLLHVLRASVDTTMFATSENVRFLCEFSTDILGDVHSHPMVVEPFVFCESSPLDDKDFQEHRFHAFMLVLCHNRRGFAVLKDGRYWYFTWY